MTHEIDIVTGPGGGFSVKCACGELEASITDAKFAMPVFERHLLHNATSVDDWPWPDSPPKHEDWPHTERED